MASLSRSLSDLENECGRHFIQREDGQNQKQLVSNPAAYVTTEFWGIKEISNPNIMDITDGEKESGLNLNIVTDGIIINNPKRRRWDKEGADFMVTGMIDDFNDILFQSEKQGYDYTRERGIGTPSWVRERLDRAMMTQELIYFFEVAVAKVEEYWASSINMDLQDRVKRCGKNLDLWGNNIRSQFKHRLRQCSILLSDQVHDDCWYWDGDPHGEYTVKQGYRLCNQSNATTMPNADSINWKQLWHLKIPVKIKCFLWRICSGSLLTNSALAAKHAVVSSLCPICNIEDESAFHALVTCSAAKKGMVQFLSW
ncbi:hypothetical protein LguiA_035740 [Lonicera macranthoides]